MNDFKFRVLEVVRQIPRGKTLSYKMVATQAGNPQAARAVGSIMRTNYDKNVPCHRVIHSDGRIGQYNRGDDKKVELLKTEMVI